MACDYFEKGEWACIRGPKPQIFATILTRASKEVSPITTFRIGRILVEKHWNHPNITREIFKIFQLFFDRVSASLMPTGYLEWFNSLYRPIDQDEFFSPGSIGTSSRST
jgi:hypothetical protein